MVAAAVAATTVIVPGAPSQAQGWAGETVPPLSKPVVGGYLLAGTPRFDGIQMDLVTHFFWAFSLVQNGRCTPASAAGIEAVLAQRRARPGLKVIRSIGGWGAGGFSCTHTYATLGPYRTTVTIIDPDPINSRMVNGLAIVTPPRS